MTGEMISVGKSEIRKDSMEKVTGEAQYVADLPIQNANTGMLVRSPHHHARLLHIDQTEARAIPGVVAVLTAKDIPGSKTFGALIADQPVLAAEVVRHMGEPVALVIARSRQAAEQAVEAIAVEYEPLPAVFEPLSALKPGAPQVHPSGNLLVEFDISDGDLQTGFNQADLVLEETFNVPRVSPAYMEPEASLAQWNPDGSLTVWVSSQKPFEDRRHIAEVLSLPQEKVQVKSAVIGGAFGGKEDSSLAILAAFGAFATHSTLRLVNTRRESFLAHPKRHPAQLHCKIGAKRDGTLTALEVTVHMDTGAYASYGPAVGGLLTEMVPGAYRIPNVHVHTLVVYTNSPYSGAMRGFGSPQAHFATESLLDMLAHKLEMDPIELRRKNVLRPGDKLFTQVVVNETARSLPQCLDHAASAMIRLRQVEPSPGKLSGVGIALSTQSMGLGHRVPDDSSQLLKWLPDGGVALYLGAPDLGQGLSTVAEQMAAEALGLPYDAVRAVGIDTHVSPNGGVTCASRMTYMVGNAVTIAARRLIDSLLDYAAKTLVSPRDELVYEGGAIRRKGGDLIPITEFIGRASEEGISFQAEGTFTFPYPKETTPQHLPIGLPHVMFCFGAQVVRVEVDPELGTVEVKDIVAIHDVGRVINRAGVEGQIEGAVSMGIGYALFESVQLKKNGKWVESFSEYLVPTIYDVAPKIECIILENPEQSGPYGAKGIAEMGVVPTAPAIANAVFDATHVRVKFIPIVPELIARIG